MHAWWMSREFSDGKEKQQTIHGAQAVACELLTFFRLESGSYVNHLKFDEVHDVFYYPNWRA
ncbi:MAG: hypothetical protein ACLFSB_14520 [Chitinispirillaceae bacterium]